MCQEPASDSTGTDTELVITYHRENAPLCLTSNLPQQTIEASPADKQHTLTAERHVPASTQDSALHGPT